MKYEDYERDEVIRHSKKKSTKIKVAKSKHKHEYFERYIPDRELVPVTEKVCSICGRSVIIKYHFRVFDRQ